MNVSRESVSVQFFALFTPLQIPDGEDLTPQQPFRTVSRYLVPPGEIDVANQPALFVVEDDENDQQRDVMALEEYALGYAVWIFAPILGSDTQAPGTLLNNLIDAVDAVVTGTGNPLGIQQTLVPWLGGQVLNTYIDGRIRKQVGIIGQGMPSVARIPITVRTGA